MTIRFASFNHFRIVYHYSNSNDPVSDLSSKIETLASTTLDAPFGATTRLIRMLFVTFWLDTLGKAVAFHLVSSFRILLYFFKVCIFKLSTSKPDKTLPSGWFHCICNCAVRLKSAYRQWCRSLNQASRNRFMQTRKKCWLAIRKIALHTTAERTAPSAPGSRSFWPLWKGDISQILPYQLRWSAAMQPV